MPWLDTSCTCGWFCLYTAGGGQLKRAGVQQVHACCTPALHKPRVGEDEGILGGVQAKAAGTACPPLRLAPTPCLMQGRALPQSLPWGGPKGTDPQPTEQKCQCPKGFRTTAESISVPGPSQGTLARPGQALLSPCVEWWPRAAKALSDIFSCFHCAPCRPPSHNPAYLCPFARRTWLLLPTRHTFPDK